MIDVKAGAAGDAAGSVTIQQWNAFEQAYYRLASALSPVTAETLRDTKNVARPRHHGFFRNIIEKLRDRSPAQRFTVKLWGWTIAFAIVILVAEPEPTCSG